MRAATRCAPLDAFSVPRPAPPPPPSIDNYEATPIAVLINFVIIPLRAQRNSPKRTMEGKEGKLQKKRNIKRTNTHAYSMLKGPKREGVTE